MCPEGSMFLPNQTTGIILSNLYSLTNALTTTQSPGRRAMNTTQTSQEFRQLSRNIVQISWDLRVAREWMYANALIRKKISEKAMLTMWLLRLCGELPQRSMARFLRLSTARTEKVLDSIQELKLIAISDDPARTVGLTEEGKLYMTKQIDEDALRYCSLLGEVGSLDQHEQVSAFTDIVLESVESHVRTWVLGRPTTEV